MSLTLKPTFPAYLIVLLLILSSCDKFKAHDDNDLLQAIYDTPSLITLESSVQTIVVDSGKRWKSIFGDRITAIPVKANVVVSYDLKEIDSTNIKIKGHTAYIRLPKPDIDIQSSEIVHDQILTEVGFFRDKFSTAEEKEIAHYGRDKIESSYEEMGILEPAKEQAQLVLSSIASHLGYKIVFEHPKIEKRRK